MSTSAWKPVPPFRSMMQLYNKSSLRVEEAVLNLFPTSFMLMSQHTGKGSTNQFIHPDHVHGGNKI